MSDVSSKELYEFKKTLKELAQKRGRGTELVSVYIPPTKQLSDVGKHMRDEMGQSANIKSKQTRNPQTQLILSTNFLWDTQNIYFVNFRGPKTL